MAGSNRELVRVVGLWGAVGMGLGSIVGTGAFVSLGIAAGIVGHGLLMAVVLAALVATANGLSSAQLAAAHPVSGGTYEYGHVFVHPLAGFWAGWLFLTAKGASAATAALGCAGYILHSSGLSDGLSLGGNGGASGLGGLGGLGTIIALLIGVMLTALVAGGIRRSSWANLIIISITLICLVLFILFGQLSLPGPSSLAWAEVHWWPDMHSWESLLHGTALLFVAYTGYGRIATLGEEVKQPARTIPKAIISTLAIAMVLYAGVALTATMVVGAQGFGKITQETVAPLEAIAQSFILPWEGAGSPGASHAGADQTKGGQWLAKLIALGAVTAMAGVLLNLLLGLSRVVLAMARRQEMPVFLAQINPNHSPRRAVWAVGLLICGLILIGDINTTWSFSAFMVLLYYGITNYCALRLPPRLRRYPRWISYGGLISCLSLAFFVDLKVWLVGLALLGLGAAWWYVARLRIIKNK